VVPGIREALQPHLANKGNIAVQQKQKSNTMAHELFIENGEASMMYTGKTPWHGLGTQLKKPATSAQAIKAARLNWNVAKKPLYAIGEGEVLRSDRYAIVREDKWGKPGCKVLGVVSEAYTPVQNRDAFTFFDNIVGNGEAIYHTAGALGNGERIWILAKLPADIRVTDDDVVNKYLLLANGHDGISSVQIKFTPVRVVCQNTLSQALSIDNTGIKISHSRNVHERLSGAAEDLGIIQVKYNELETAFKQMSLRSLNTADLNAYYSNVFPIPKKIKTKADKDKLKSMGEMRLHSTNYFENGKGNNLRGVKRTLWAAYNGITEYIDHHRELKNGADKLNYIWFGGGHAIKAKAFAEACRQMK